MDPLLKQGLQRKFSIIGLIIILLLFAGLTYYIISLFLTPPTIETPPEKESEEGSEPPEEVPLEETPVLPVKQKDEFLYVISKAAKEVTVIDTLTDKKINRVSLTKEPDFAYYNKEDKRLYISHSGSYLITVININNPAVRKIELNERPGDLVVVNGLIYVAMPEIDKIYLINPLTEVIEKKIETGKQPQRLALSKDKTRIYCTNKRSETVTVISTSVKAKLE
jgi:DNA-binding beta-propeller fold protein YncE